VRSIPVKVNGAVLPVYSTESVSEFTGWLMEQGQVAVDTETTGLDIYNAGASLRLLQVGSANEAVVLPIERMGEHARMQVGNMLAAHAERFPLVFHNATFDRLFMDAHGVLPLEALSPEQWEDTRILSHLVDPRPKQEGGYGHGLKELSDLFVDPDASGEGQAVLKELFRESGWTKNNGWALIDLDHPDYVRYAGLDVILTVRLLPVLARLIADMDLGNLYLFERQVADLCARMERRGLRVDTEYVETDLLPWLEEQEEIGVAEALGWGVENVNSTAQVAEALTGLGWEPAEFTATGKPKVDKAVMTALAAEGNPIAAAVMKAKQAGKRITSYAEPLLSDVDAAGRVHPKINALQARTARMSVARPPLQQLPSGDWRIRRAIVPDSGNLMWAADYDQVELRVLAAMADEQNMKRAIADGTDLHDYTATMVFGEGFTKAQRKLAKNIGFGRVYGGGAATISRLSGTPFDDVKRAMNGYDTAFPGIKRYQKRLESSAQVGKRQVVTASGRPIPLDGDRMYAATNYAVQSSARDVLAQALLLLEEKGIRAGHEILLPIHDEIIGECHPDAYEEISRTIGEAMTMDFFGVRLTAAAELLGDGTSWGAGYMS